MPYYQGLAEREQRLLLFAATALPLMLLIFGLMLPLNDALIAKKQALASLQTQAQEAEMLAIQLQQQGDQPERGNSMSIVDQQARQAGVRQFITNLRPQMSGTEARLWIQMRNAPYHETVQFLEALAKQGVSLTQVKLQKGEQAGFVHLQAVVQ